MFRWLPIERSRDQRVAVVDIGSNSIRLVVYRRLSRAPLPVFNEKVLCGLGRNLSRTGRLDPDGMRMALINLQRFARLLPAMVVVHVDVLATAAVREAADGADFVAKVAECTGLGVQVLDGPAEARLAGLGVRCGFPAASGLAGDLGGGTLELCAIDAPDAAAPATASLPLGHLRLAEAGTRPKTPAVERIDRALASVPWLGPFGGRPFYAVGGSWRALAKLHMTEGDHPLQVIHGYAIGCDDAIRFADRIASASKSQIDQIGAGVGRRADTLVQAAMVLARLLRLVRPSEVVFSAYGLREGHLFSLLPPEARTRDPLIDAASDLIHRLGRFGDGPTLFNWCAPLFPDAGPAIRRLHHAACLLSDLGWVEHPDYRAAHACLRILRMPFAGITHADRGFLALAVHARYDGSVEGSETDAARRLAGASGAARALTLGLALRLAHTLSGGVPALLGRTALAVDPSTITLTLPRDLAPLAGEVPRRRLEALARSLGRQAVIDSGTAAPITWPHLVVD